MAKPPLFVVDEAFQARAHAHAAAGLPIGEAPDLADFPDRALALSGWTLGLYPRIDPMTGLPIEEGGLSVLEQQRIWADA